MTGADLPLVSVVVTTYDRPGLCKRALRSVRSQTYDELEIIVVEDGTETGIKEWVTDELPSATYIKHDSNQGLAAARNTGLDEAEGEYVAYLDDDDEWKPDRVARQVQKLRSFSLKDQKAVGVIYCGVERHQPDGTVHSTGLPQNEGDLAAAIRQHWPTTLPSTCLFKREALHAVGGFDESLASSIDHDIWMALATEGYYAVTINDPLVITYVDDRESMVTNTEQRLKGIEQFVEKWTPTYKEWFGPEEGKRYGERYFARVTARLVGSNVVAGEIIEAWHSMRAIFAYSNQHRYNITVLSWTVAVTAVVTFCPPRLLAALRAVKNNV